MHRSVALIGLFSFLCLMTTGFAFGTPQSFFQRGIWMYEGKPVGEPKGYREMCLREPDLCPGSSQAPKIIPSPEIYTNKRGAVLLNEKLWRELQEINHRVNATIVSVTDREQYGISDYWTLPDVAGDCEDYVIFKRWQLLKNGWPESAVLIGIVKGEVYPYHAVLIVRTDAGDLVLDNQYEYIVNWNRTDYEWVIRQSYKNPRRWVHLEPPSFRISSPWIIDYPNQLPQVKG